MENAPRGLALEYGSRFIISLSISLESFVLRTLAATQELRAMCFTRVESLEHRGPRLMDRAFALGYLRNATACVLSRHTRKRYTPCANNRPSIIPPHTIVSPTMMFDATMMSAVPGKPRSKA